MSGSRFLPLAANWSCQNAELPALVLGNVIEHSVMTVRNILGIFAHAEEVMCSPVPVGWVVSVLLCITQKCSKPILTKHGGRKEHGHPLSLGVWGMRGHFSIFLSKIKSERQNSGIFIPQC